MKKIITKPRWQRYTWSRNSNIITVGITRGFWPCKAPMHSSYESTYFMKNRALYALSTPPSYSVENNLLSRLAGVKIKYTHYISFTYFFHLAIQCLFSFLLGLCHSEDGNIHPCCWNNSNLFHGVYLHSLHWRDPFWQTETPLEFSITFRIMRY